MCCFFLPALEVIGEQEKVLQDTRDFFSKTAAYFAIETAVSSFMLMQFTHSIIVIVLLAQVVISYDFCFLKKNKTPSNSIIFI